MRPSVTGVISGRETRLTGGDLELGMRVIKVPERGFGLDLRGEVNVEFVVFLLLELSVVCDAPVYVWYVARLIQSTRARDVDLPFSVNVRP